MAMPFDARHFAPHDQGRLHPQSHWKKVRTTNAIERAFREVRRRTRAMSSLTNPDRYDRIVFGMISHLKPLLGEKTLKEFTQNA